MKMRNGCSIGFIRLLILAAIGTAITLFGELLSMPPRQVWLLTGFGLALLGLFLYQSGTWRNVLSILVYAAKVLLTLVPALFFFAIPSLILEVFYPFNANPCSELGWFTLHRGCIINNWILPLFVMTFGLISLLLYMKFIFRPVSKYLQVLISKLRISHQKADSDRTNLKKQLD